MNDSNFKLDNTAIMEINEELFIAYVLNFTDCKRVLGSILNKKRWKNGIRTAEKEHQLDIIVYATGFLLKENYDFITKAGFAGRSRQLSLTQTSWIRRSWIPDEPNKAIDEQWQGPTRTYYGTFHPKAPNFATFLGPMTGLGHNSIIFMIECQAQLLINALREMWDNKGFLQFVVVQARKSGLWLYFKQKHSKSKKKH